MLAGPAFVVMLAVTAYPILQAVYDSLFDFRLTDPDNRAFTGLTQLRGDPHRPHLVDESLGVTLFITVVTVAVELVLGFALALVMMKALSTIRPVVRAAILIPYAVITVVSAFAWQFAFDIDTGFVNTWFAWLPGIAADTDWFGGTWSSLFVDLPRRDLEDHAVHLPAAARRPGPGARGAAGGGQGRRRHLVAADVAR